MNNAHETPKVQQSSEQSSSPQQSPSPVAQQDEMFEPPVRRGRSKQLSHEQIRHLRQAHIVEAEAQPEPVHQSKELEELKQENHRLQSELNTKQFQNQRFQNSIATAQHREKQLKEKIAELERQVADQAKYIQRHQHEHAVTPIVAPLPLAALPPNEEQQHSIVQNIEQGERKLKFFSFQIGIENVESKNWTLRRKPYVYC